MRPPQPEMNGRPPVYVVVLNYNGAEDTVECLESLRRADDSCFRVVVVDNCSTDGSADLLRRGYPEHLFIQTGANLGYAGGYNAGIRCALDRGADHVCILNNDTTVSPGFLGPMLRAMDADPAAGIIGPMVCEHRDPDIVQAAGSAANLYLGRFRQLHSGERRDEVRGLFEADYVGGACLLVRAGLVRKIGAIPEHYFLFFEETEWCLAARRAGYKVLCDCDSVIYHKGSRSTRRVAGAIAYYMTRNQIIFERRNATALQWSTFLVYRTFQFALSMAKGLITGRIDRDMVRGFRDGLAYRRGA